MKRARISAGAILAMAALSPFVGACGGASPSPMSLRAEDVRAVRAVPPDEPTVVPVGHGTVDSDAKVTVVEGVDSRVRFSPPIPLRTALEEADVAGDVKVFFPSPEPDVTVVEVGAYSALAGAGISGVGFLMILGAAALGGPAYDHSDVIRAGGVTFLVGTGVAALGGITALAGYTANLPRDPSASGRATF